jgi:hypothetical protein
VGQVVIDDGPLLHPEQHHQWQQERMLSANCASSRNNSAAAAALPAQNGIAYYQRCSPSSVLDRAIGPDLIRRGLTDDEIAAWAS